jgi:endonuclease/exonuclease/phosphatase family metal-dependent hydrolase
MTHLIKPPSFIALLVVFILVGCHQTAPAEREPVTVKAMTYNLWGRASGEELAKLIDASGVGILATQENGDGKQLDRAAQLLGPEWTAIYPGYDTPHLKQPPGRRPNFWVGGHHMPAALITKYQIVEHQFYNITDTPDDWIDARVIECYRSCLRVRLKVDDGHYVTVFSLHGNPWNSAWRVREFADVIAQLDHHHPGDTTILLGDFNAVPHTDKPEDPNDAKATKQFADAGFVDTFRAVHPDAQAEPGLTNKSGRIDLIYLRHGEVIDSFVVREPVFGLKDADSDHQPVFSAVTAR